MQPTPAPHLTGALLACPLCTGFSTFGGSVNTCFALLLGDTAVNSDLQALRGLLPREDRLFAAHAS